MPRQNPLPQLNGQTMLTYTGMETDLIFTQGIDLPGFATFPLLETEAGCERLRGYYRDLIAVGQQTGHAVILEAPTWVANKDRAAALGYAEQSLRGLNIAAVKLVADIRESAGAPQTLLSANVGPRCDAYAPSTLMNAREAEAYHSVQMASFALTDCDFVSAFTLAYVDEATGIARAAQRQALPVVISFTVETDGRLPDGTELRQAILAVDAATADYVSYYMVNCAHADHFAAQLSNAPWGQRIKGAVVNASRCSHAELDNATQLDDGDPVALGAQLARLARKYPHLTVLGGCCGTGMRHMLEIGQSLQAVGK